LYQEGWFDYIELYVVPGSLETLPKWQNLKVPFIIHNAHFMNGFNLAKREKREDNFKLYQETKRFADALGSQYIVFHGGMDGTIEETARQLNSFKEPRALIENKPYKALRNKMNGIKCRGSSPEEIEYVLREAHCGFCLDFGHAVCAANSQQANPKDYIARFVKLVPAMYHISDVEDMASEYDSHAHFGCGQMDIKSLLRKMPDDAIVTIETNKDSKEDLRDFIEDAQWLRNIK
jgi:endonuclease IV